MILGYLDPGSGSILLQSVLFGLLVWLLPAVLVANYAQRKGQSFGIYLLIGLFLSWIIALVVLLIVDAIGSSSEAKPSPADPS
jgi:hypothetical protein